MKRRFHSIILLAAMTVGPARPPAELAATYHVRLESAWPQVPADEGCENGGSETVEGTLTRNPTGDYGGTFTRRTHLLFCGAHGRFRRGVRPGAGRPGPSRGPRRRDGGRAESRAAAGCA